MLLEIWMGPRLSTAGPDLHDLARSFGSATLRDLAFCNRGGRGLSYTDITVRQRQGIGDDLFAETIVGRDAAIGTLAVAPYARDLSPLICRPGR